MTADSVPRELEGSGESGVGLGSLFKTFEPIEEEMHERRFLGGSFLDSIPNLDREWELGMD